MCEYVCTTWKGLCMSYLEDGMYVCACILLEGCMYMCMCVLCDGCVCVCVCVCVHMYVHTTLQVLPSGTRRTHIILMHTLPQVGS